MVCPISTAETVDSNCTIKCEDTTCKYLMVENVAGAYMTTFSMICGVEKSCQYTDIDLDPTSIKFIDIVCSAKVCST